MFWSTFHEKNKQNDATWRQALWFLIILKNNPNHDHNLLLAQSQQLYPKPSMSQMWARWTKTSFSYPWYLFLLESSHQVIENMKIRQTVSSSQTSLMEQKKQLALLPQLQQLDRSSSILLFSSYSLCHRLPLYINSNNSDDIQFWLLRHRIDRSRWIATQQSTLLIHQILNS